MQSPTAFLLDLLAPPRCALCALPSPPRAPVCSACDAELAGASPVPAAIPATDAALAAAPYEGAPRRLVTALKFSGRVALADRAASAIEVATRGWLIAGVVVPVPAAPRRRRRRGFDPADLIAVALARRAGLPVARCLMRADGPRQVGRPRAARLADPPRTLCRGSAPNTAVLVDDVITTGATLGACAAALRAGGSERVVALALAAASPPRA